MVRCFWGSLQVVFRRYDFIYIKVAKIERLSIGAEIKHIKLMMEERAHLALHRVNDRNPKHFERGPNFLFYLSLKNKYPINESAKTIALQRKACRHCDLVMDAIPIQCYSRLGPRF